MGGLLSIDVNPIRWSFCEGVFGVGDEMPITTMADGEKERFIG